jgi:hypothetical protein
MELKVSVQLWVSVLVQQLNKHMNTNKEIETFINNLALIKQGEDECSKFSIYKGKSIEVTLMLDDKDVSILYVYGKRHELVSYENGELQATLESNWDYIKQLGILH